MKKLFRRLSMFFAVGAMIFGSGLVAHDNKSNSKVDNIVARAAGNKLSNIVGGVMNPLPEGGYNFACAAVANASGYHIQFLDSNDVVKAEQDITNGGTITCLGSLAAGTYKVQAKAVGNGEYEDSDYVIINNSFVIASSSGSEESGNTPSENEYYTVEAKATSGAANHFKFTWKSNEYKVTKAPTREDCSVSVGSVDHIDKPTLTAEYLEVNIVTGAESNRNVSIILHTDNGDFKLTMIISGGVYTNECTVESVDCNHETNEEIIASVEEKINAIGTVELTKECKAKIDAARDEYNKLDDSLKSRVTNYETLRDAEAEYERLLNTLDLVERPIAIDESQTRMEGAGIFVYLKDKPNISLDDFTITAVLFESTQFGYAKDNMMKEPNKVEYIQQNGKLYFTVEQGFDQGFTFIFNVTYTIDSTIYTQNITIVDNAYQPNRFPSITNAAASDLMPSTNGESTSDRYFLNGNVLEITDETNGAFSFVDLEGNEIDVISSSLLDTTYADMTNRLNRKDDVVVYGAISNKDGEAVINSAIIVSINRIAQEETFKLISEVISADTCNDYSKAADYRNRYNELSTDKQNIFDSIVINCKANKDDTSLSETVSLGDKLAYMETINAREATKSEASLLNSFVSSNNISIILVVGLLGLAAIAGYYFLNKKKYC